jgi:hypothetical protein
MGGRMKFDFTEMVLLMLSALLLSALLLGMASCSTPNAAKQKKHYDKFIYYGGKIDTVTRTVTAEIIVKGKDGKDSLIYIDVPVKCPEAQIQYKDRWHIRRMDKAERDSMKHVEKMSKIQAKLTIDSLNRVIKIEKQKKGQKKHDAKKNKKYSWMWALLFIGIFVFIVIRFK